MTRTASTLAEPLDETIGWVHQLRDQEPGTSPTMFFDYLAVGLPVLINYPGWLADVIEEREFGLVGPPEGPVAFADALERAAADRSALKAMGRRAHELGRKASGGDLLADRWVDRVETAGVVIPEDVSVLDSRC
jgi:glycosyltransferase involved in cell wall biosynthesis